MQACALPVAAFVAKSKGGGGSVGGRSRWLGLLLVVFSPFA